MQPIIHHPPLKNRYKAKQLTQQEYTLNPILYYQRNHISLQRNPAGKKSLPIPIAESGSKQLTEARAVDQVQAALEPMMPVQIVILRCEKNSPGVERARIVVGPAELIGSSVWSIQIICYESGQKTFVI
jgi:hypothetical protein